MPQWVAAAPAGIDNNDRIESFFSDITYQKGGAVLRMLRAYLARRTATEQLQPRLRRSLSSDTAAEPLQLHLRLSEVRGGDLAVVPSQGLGSRAQSARWRDRRRRAMMQSGAETSFYAGSGTSSVAGVSAQDSGGSNGSGGSGDTGGGAASAQDSGGGSSSGGGGTDSSVIVSAQGSSSSSSNSVGGGGRGGSPDPFFTGIQAYLKRHQFGSVSAADLWAAISASSGEAAPLLG